MWNRLYSWIAGAALIVAALLGIRRTGTKSERERQEAAKSQRELAAAQKRIDDLKTAREKQHETDTLPDGDALDRLRKHWNRDDPG